MWNYENGKWRGYKKLSVSKEGNGAAQFCEEYENSLRIENGVVEEE